MALGICALLIVAGADDRPGQNDPQNNQNQAPQQNQRDNDRPQAGQGQDAEGKTVRASELIGKPIENSQGERVGQIEDLVIEADTGAVAYAAVTYEELPEARNQMFAVPFMAFEAKHDPNTHECTLVLDVTQQQLQRAEGFDANNWPDFSDLQFTSGIDELYGVEREDDHGQQEQQEGRPAPGARP
jgi:sporulation protein YlmC with PRC-barrel domain